MILMKKALPWERDLGSNAGSVTHQFCEPGETFKCLLVLVSLSIKWEEITFYSNRAVLRIKIIMSNVYLSGTQ